jgi:hypothetical protein
LAKTVWNLESQFLLKERIKAGLTLYQKWLQARSAVQEHINRMPQYFISGRTDVTCQTFKQCFAPKLDALFRGHTDSHNGQYRVYMIPKLGEVEEKYRFILKNEPGLATMALDYLLHDLRVNPEHITMYFYSDESARELYVQMKKKGIHIVADPKWTSALDRNTAFALVPALYFL